MLKIFPIGGIGKVTKNMFIYELNNDLLVIDSGIGFAPQEMPGVDILVPDTKYLQDRLKQGAILHGIVLTHGHDDHIAALPYVLRDLEGLVTELPLYASPLAAEFAMTRMVDQGIDKKVEYFDQGQLKLGPFTLETIRVTHSVPDTRHLVIRTPEGIIYHGSDYKLDLTPVDGQTTELQKIANIGQEGVLCALLDCLRIERQAPTASESVIKKALLREMHGVDGKVIVTLMSSNLHRIQQVIDVAAEFGRRVGFIGRSVEQNVNTAMNMGLLSFPPNLKVNKKNLSSVPDSQLCLIVAGSQGQAGSSLVRAVSGEHNYLSISKKDKIVVASEPIPGNETNIYGVINEIAEQGIEVAYSDVEDDLHVSGHAGEYEQMLIVHLLRPKYLFPIGGEERHRVRFAKVVEQHNYRPSQVVMPKYGKIVEFQDGAFRYGDEIKLRERTVTVAGTTSQVMDQVLNDREILGKQGVVLVVLTEQAGIFDIANMSVEERGLGLTTPEERQQLRVILQDCVREVLAGNGNSANKKESADKSALGRDNLVKQLKQAIRKRIKQESDREPLVVVMLMGL